MRLITSLASLSFFVVLAACTTETIVVPIPTDTKVPAPSSTATGTAPPALPEPSAPPVPPVPPPVEERADVRASVGKVLAHYRLGSSTASQGKEIVVLPLTLENRGPRDLPFSLAKLSVAVKGGAQVPAFAAATRETEKPCGEVSVLGRGVTVTCSVAFELGQDAALSLRYQAQNDYAAVAVIPPVARCHDLVHVGQAVTTVTFNTSPAAIGTLPPDGTYVAQVQFVRNATPDAFPPVTLRIRGGVADESYTLGGITLQFKYALTSQADHVRLDLTCVSPAYDDAQRVARTVYHWDTNAQMLYMAVGGNDTWIGFRKL